MSSSWDEFLRSKLMSWMYLNKFWPILHPWHHLVDIGRPTNFWHIWSSKFVEPDFRISKNVVKWYQIGILMNLWTLWGYICFQLILCSFIQCCFWDPQLFSFSPLIHKLDMFTSATRSSSGWVLMVRKVLPSKSSWSEEYFEYLSYPHIFPRSKDIYKFTKKLHPVVSYIWMHHM